MRDEMELYWQPSEGDYAGQYPIEQLKDPFDAHATEFVDTVSLRPSTF